MQVGLEPLCSMNSKTGDGFVEDIYRADMVPNVKNSVGLSPVEDRMQQRDEEASEVRGVQVDLEDWQLDFVTTKPHSIDLEIAVGKIPE